MALINCPDCLIEISDQAANCLKCGRPIKRDIQQAQLSLFFKNTILPVINQGIIFITAVVLGIVGKILMLSFTVIDVFDRYPMTDIVWNAISESGLYILFAFIILTALIKYRWLSNKVMYVFSITILTGVSGLTLSLLEYSVTIPALICLSLALVSYQNLCEV